MLKLHNFFIINVLGLFVGSYILASLITFVTLKTFIIGEYYAELSQSIKLIQMQLPNVYNLDAFAQKIHKTLDVRLTVIDKSGRVVAESNFDKTKMGLHSNRPEIIALEEQEFGKSVRYSHTVNEEFVYVSKRVRYRAQEVVVRLAVSLKKVKEQLYNLFSILLALFIFFIIMAIYMTVVMNKRISYDITQISHYLEEISEKNYKAVIKIRYFSEFLQIALSLKNLAKKLHSRDKQKRKYTARLRLINKQRNDILSAISHEFKNPIASIMGYSETLVEDDNISLKMRQRFLEKIVSNAKKITRMIDRLALSVKLENGDLEPEKSPFSLLEVAQEVILNISKKYPDRVIDLRGEALHVKADKTMIENVLINLVDNALKYSQESVIISIEGSKVLVIDRGLGLDDKDREKVTSKFYRVDKNSWDNSMGLGLAIVSYILNLHGCPMIIESKLGEGSIFGFDCKEVRI